jgi:hypothetical protein
MKFDRLDQILAGAQLDAQRTGKDMTEGERVALVKGAGGFPAGCGPAPSDAPARGPLKVEVMMTAFENDDGAVEAQPAGFEGRSTARIADVFDLMAARGKQRFTPSQIATARAYGFMFERHSAGGMKCASWDTAPSGGGAGGGEWIDAFLAEGDAIRAMERRIGNGLAFDPERVGEGQVAITCKALAQAVCLEGLSMSAVLRRHGWHLKGRALARAVDAMADALGAALDRMGQTVGMSRIVAMSDAGFHEGVKDRMKKILDK